MARCAPLLVALPSGLIVSGVATWAVRLVSALAARGRVAGLILHATPPGHAGLEMDLHPGVRVFDLAHLPRFEDAAPGLRTPVEIAAAREAWTTAYHDAAGVLARDAWGAQGAGPVVLSPNLHADCYATCVEVARRDPSLVRVVGWQHNDIEYDRRMLAHYDAALSCVVGVSDHIVSLLRTLLPDRPIASVAYGVEVPDAAPVRPPLVERGRARPIRLLYSGRLDHHQKRVLALAYLSAELVGMGIEHVLTIAGDGPASAELDRLIGLLGTRRNEASIADSIGAGPRGRIGVAMGIAVPEGGRPTSGALPIVRLGAATPARVRSLLHEHDALVLASRFEGLSVAMLEAMAAGCVPIVTRVASGALQAVEDGRTGLVAEADPTADEAEVARALAQSVARLLAGDGSSMSRLAWRVARERYSIERHASAACAVLDAASDSPAPAWSRDRSVWFSDAGGSVPADVHVRLRALLERLSGRRLVVHGTGLHTRTILAELLKGPARVVGFCDDDRQRHGQSLGGLPIVAPDDARTLGASDVVISSWLHEAGVWAARGVYERQGLRVHRLYADARGDDSRP